MTQTHKIKIIKTQKTIYILKNKIEHKNNKTKWRGHTQTKNTTIFCLFIFVKTQKQIRNTQKTTKKQ